MKILVNCDQPAGELPHFWRSTGFSPASLLLNADMQQQIIYAAASGGISYVRIHYLLDLVRGTGFGTGSVTYDWSALDQALDVLVESGLHPFFELMGNPAGWFTDLTDPVQVDAWRALVRDLARHLIDRYGADTVQQWYFESWNEPDAWWPFSQPGFLNYYDACSEGLHDIDPALPFGGPCTSETLSPYFKTLLAHCDTGRNYFTGETGTRLDFISVHEKGAPPTREDITPDTAQICTAELAAVAYIREHHPRFAALPFMNNECDPQVGWQHHHTWRGLPYYPAIVCRMIDQHLQRLHDEAGVNYMLFSGDHGFVGEWGHRTLTARFGQIEDRAAQSEHKTQAHDLQEDPNRRAFELVKKPVLTLMSLLNLLGDERCTVTHTHDSGDPVGVIATRRSDNQIAVLVYHSRDRIYADGEAEIMLTLSGLPFDSAVLAHYRIDETHSNPFTIWAAYGANRYPHTDPAVYPAMRQHHEPALLENPVPVSGDTITLTFTLPLPAVSLLLLTAETDESPQPPSRLRLTRYEGLHEPGMMIAWDMPPQARRIRTYEVLYSSTPDGPFMRVNPLDTICTAYLHHNPPQQGWYRVRVIDYHGHHADSEPINIGENNRGYKDANGRSTTGG